MAIEEMIYSPVYIVSVYLRIFGLQHVYDRQVSIRPWPDNKNDMLVISDTKTSG